jgi:hypothetical protein
MMAEKSWFFTEVGSAPTYGPDDFSAWLYNAMFRNDGVLKGLDNSLAVTSDGAGNALIATGCAMKGGYGYQNTSILTMGLTLPAVGYQNINTLVVRVDSGASPNLMHAYKLVGSSVANPGPPAAPAITAGTDVYLCDILIVNTAGSYAYTVTDKRAFAKVQANGLLGANWEAALESAGPNGANWLAAIGAVLGSNMKQLMADDLGTGWEALLKVASINIFQGQKVLLTSGSGNWTVPSGVTQIRVTCIGGGGGGGGGGTGSPGNGGTGGSTTFTGATTGVGGSGGGAYVGSLGIGGAGPAGGAGSAGSSSGNSPGCGGGAGGAPGAVGSYGGGGGGGPSVSAGYGGGGGGGTLISLVPASVLSVTPGALIAYSVGAGGSAGAAGTNGSAGGVGGSGLIIIEY